MSLLIRRGELRRGFKLPFLHFGQKCEERCATNTRFTGVPQFKQGSPVRWYRTAELKKPSPPPPRPHNPKSDPSAPATAPPSEPLIMWMRRGGRGLLSVQPSRVPTHRRALLKFGTPVKRALGRNAPRIFARSARNGNFKPPEFTASYEQVHSEPVQIVFSDLQACPLGDNQIVCAF